MCTLLLMALCAGCDGHAPSQQQVQQQASQTAATVKQDAQQAVVATREAAGAAEQDVNAVASGVKSGLDKNSPAHDDLKANLNTSTQIRLAMLPGISMAKAGEIVDKRPYASGRQLVSRGVLTAGEYAKISKDVVVR